MDLDEKSCLTKGEKTVVNILFYISYVSMIVLFGSLSPSQLNKGLHQSFRIFVLLTILVISIDITSIFIGSSFPRIKSLILNLQAIEIFVILFQLRKTTLSKISIMSYIVTLVGLIGYSVYSMIEMFM